MPLVQTRGAASAQGFGEFAQATAVNYIEDVFSTFLYTGDGSSAQNINNGIDLAGKGGMVWVKSRSNATTNVLVDTNRFVSSSNIQNLFSDSTAAASASANEFGSFNSNGFSIPYNTTAGWTNFGTRTFVSWTFREQPKFFDVVTYTGNGVAGRQISHNLGSVPGCIILKSTSEAGVNWNVFHRSIAPTGTLRLNLSDAQTSNFIEYYFGNDTAYVAPTSSVFTVGGSGAGNQVNGSGATYVAYLFAHDAGGFGLTGTDNVISCGSFTTDGSGNATVNLGYEPQFLIHKATTGSESWLMLDTMRGWNMSTADRDLFCNSASAEASGNYGDPTATGFTAAGLSATRTYIYIAIRRGPMKVPTLGTSVFGLSARTGTGADATVTGGQTDDAVLIKNRGSAVASLFSSRLTGTGYLVTSDTAAEVAAGTTILQANPWDVMDGVKVGTTSTITNASANTYINWLFRRAPGFFDVVCYTGTGVATTQTHNLAAVPELMIIKRRSAIGSWGTFFGMGASNYYRPLLNSDVPAPLVTYSDGFGLSAQPTSTVINLDSGGAGNDSGTTYVAYLFATCAGVSKVGTYTGNGTTQTINCGFTGGARFVLIKRTDNTGDWYVWDSARGIVAGNDPYLLFNSTAAEVTGTDYIDTASTGFEISSTAPAAINANGGSFIFLAIA
jgi:hypothetical protein